MDKNLRRNLQRLLKASVKYYSDRSKFQTYFSPRVTKLVADEIEKITHEDLLTEAHASLCSSIYSFSQIKEQRYPRYIFNELIAQRDFLSAIILLKVPEKK